MLYFRQFVHYNFRPEVGNNVVSSEAVEYGMSVKNLVMIQTLLGRFQVLISRRINERTNEHVEAYHIRQKHLIGVSPKL